MKLMLKMPGKPLVQITRQGFSHSNLMDVYRVLEHFLPPGATLGIVADYTVRQPIPNASCPTCHFLAEQHQKSLQFYNTTVPVDETVAVPPIEQILKDAQIASQT